MKQIGNLAIVCALRPNVLFQLHNGDVTVHVGSGPQRVTLSAKWNDDAQISAIIYELNFGQYKSEDCTKINGRANYTVDITETLSRGITVIADSGEDALEIVRKGYTLEEHVLDSSDFCGVEFSIGGVSQ